MKRILFFSLIAVFISPGPVSAVLTVYEYIPGQKVTYDDVTGNYWYWNLADFTYMTYAEQISAISGLGTYGYVGGGWHMASLDEMEDLWTYSTNHLAGHFNPSYYWGLEKRWRGRYDYDWVPPFASGVHGIGEIWATRTATEPWDTVKMPLGWALFTPDSFSEYHTGAWVVSDHPVVPLPGSLLLSATGLLPLLGLNRLRRKH